MSPSNPPSICPQYTVLLQLGPCADRLNRPQRHFFRVPRVFLTTPTVSHPHRGHRNGRDNEVKAAGVLNRRIDL